MTEVLLRAVSSAPLCLALLLSGCGGFSLWPFGDKGQEQSSVPANATEYQCDGGKRFYVRDLENGAAAWVIFPERQVRLDRVAGSGTSYSNGIAVFEINGNEATLTDGPSISYKGCKRAGK